MPVKNRIQLRRGTTQQWGETIDVLKEGEIGFDSDVYNVKIGDGKKTWANLPWLVDISGQIVSVTGEFDVLKFNTNPGVIPAEGQAVWDSTYGTLSIGLAGDHVLNLGQETHFRIRNETGDTLYKGQAVYATGVHDDNIRIEADKYISDGTIREVRFIGLVSEDVTDNGSGFTTNFGYVRGNTISVLDTRGNGSVNGAQNLYTADEPAWAQGDILYVHPTVPGKLTKIEPKHSISIALVVRVHQEQGVLLVRPTSYGHLDDNHDVSTSGVQNNQYLIYNSGTDLWTPTSSGIFNNVYASGNVGIGIAAPSGKLHVIGDSYLNDNVYIPYGNLEIGSSDILRNTSITLYGNHAGNKRTVLQNVNGGAYLSYLVGSQSLNFGSPPIGGNRWYDINYYAGSSIGGKHKFYTTNNTDPDVTIVSDGTQGYVGIGTSAPSGILHIYDNNSAGYNDTSFRIENPASANNTYFDIAIGTNTGYNDYVWFKRQGNPIAGISSTNTWYHHADATIATDKQIRAVSNANAFIELLDTSNDMKIGYLSDLRFYSSYVEKMVLDVNGKLGIGTSSPQAKTHVVSVSNGDELLRLQATANTGGGTRNLRIVGDGSSIDFGVYDNAGSKGTWSYLRLNREGGYVGINTGTGYPTTALDVSGVITATGGNSTNWNSAYSFVNSGGSVGGNVTIGGDFTVNGSTVIANVSAMEIEDPILTLGLASGNIITDDSYDRGIAMVTNSGTAFMGWDNSADRFVLLSSGVATNNGNNYDAGTYGDLQLNRIHGGSGNTNILFNLNGTNRVDIGSTTYSNSNAYLGTQYTWLNSQSTYVNGSLSFPRTAVSTSTATQSNPNSIFLYNGLWTGSQDVSVGNQIASLASTTTNLESRLAFLMQNGDGTSNRTERLSIVSDGKVGIGNSSPTHILTVSHTGVTPNSAMQSSSGSTAAFYSQGSSLPGLLISMASSGGATSRGSVYMNRSRGTLDAPEAVASGDWLGSYYGAGYDGSNLQRMGGVIFVVDGNVSTGNVPTSIIFQTGSSSRTEKMRIGSNGNVGIGTATPSSTLHVVGDIAIDNLKLDGNTISATNSLGSLILMPGTSGDIRASDTGNERGDYAIDLQLRRSDQSNVAAADYSVLVGGQYSTIRSTGRGGSIIGGLQNELHGTAAFIGGSDYSKASGNYSSVIAGYNNLALSDYSHIAGGQTNNISGGINAGIIAGRLNDIYGSYSFIGAGYNNTVSGDYSSIIGGVNNSDNNLDRVIILGGSGILASQSNTTYTESINASGSVNIYSQVPSGTLFNVEGTNGNLFSVVDSVDGSLLSVNDITGLPAFEVFSDHSIIAGRFNQNDFIINSDGDIGIGTDSPSYKLQVNGSFGATTKSFRIDHPSRPNYTLEYGSLESPYHGVRLTGRGKVVKGVCVVDLPPYLKNLIHDDENINIQLTNLKHGKTLYVGDIDLNNSQFTVKADRAKTVGDLEFFWTFTGVRKDVENLVVEKPKEV